MDHLATTSAPNNSSIREAIQTELEANRVAFRAMIDSLSEKDLRRKSANPAWTIRELLLHMAVSLEYVPREVKAAQQGKNLMKMPQVMYDPINTLLTRIWAMAQTRQSLLQKYEAAHLAALESLASVQDHEWHKSTTFFYVEATVEQLFRRQAKHIEEHMAQIQQSFN